MRVIAGEWRGRRISTPDGRDVRPTTDRVREAIFGSIGARVVDANVLDVFGGSGALGIEAASRGAAHVVIIERSRWAQDTIRKNLSSLDKDRRVRLICAPYEKAMRLLSGRMRFDIILLDPPYASGQYVPALETIQKLGIAAPDALFVLESDRELQPDLPDFEITKRKRYGSVHVAYGEFLPSDVPEEDTAVARESGDSTQCEAVL